MEIVYRYRDNKMRPKYRSKPYTHILHHNCSLSVFVVFTNCSNRQAIDCVCVRTCNENSFGFVEALEKCNNNTTHNFKQATTYNIYRKTEKVQTMNKSHSIEEWFVLSVRKSQMKEKKKNKKKLVTENDLYILNFCHSAY